MASFEIKEPNKAKIAHIEHDRDTAVAWADTKSKEDGKTYEVYETKQVYVTSVLNGVEIIDNFF